MKQKERNSKTPSSGNKKGMHLTSRNKNKTFSTMNRTRTNKQNCLQILKKIRRNLKLSEKRLQISQELNLKRESLNEEKMKPANKRKKKKYLKRKKKRRSKQKQKRSLKTTIPDSRRRLE